MKMIAVIVAPNGDITVEAFGYRGPECNKSTEVLENVLGLPLEKVRKPEYFAGEELGNRAALES